MPIMRGGTTLSYRLAADIGGTFTDIVLVNDTDGTYKTTKVLTTPHALEEGILKGFNELLHGDYSQVTSIVYGTTAGLNAIIERRGAKSALLTTKGFRDVYEIARANRPEIYNCHYNKPMPLIPRKDIFEIDERVSAMGEVEKPVTRETLESLIDTLRGFDSVAICLINSYVNPVNERALCEILRKEYGEKVIVTASHEIAQEAKEYERTSTAVINAYVAPSTRHHVYALFSELRKLGFSGTLYMMQSSGGVIRAELAAIRAVKTLMSGPVGGAIGASVIDRDNIIGFDIGGTSFDVSIVINNRIESTVESTIEGFPVLTPTVNVFSIGAGGGSIAWEEAGGMRVGPQSAGAVPGPVCYDRGGNLPTITDANLVLGHMAPKHFLGGRMDIAVEKTYQALDEYGKVFGLNRVTAAEGICTIANHKMADAIRELTVRRGIDPRDFTIVAFGGAGPMHAALIAEELDIKEVIVPPNPGVFSAWGMLQADIRHDSVRTHICLLNDLSETQFNKAYEDQRIALVDILQKEQIPESKGKFIRSLDMRYFGQEYTISIDIPEGAAFSKDDIENQFNTTYERLYGHHSPDDIIEIVNYRLTVTVPVNRVPVRQRQGDGEIAVIDQLPGYFEGKEYQMRIYDRLQLVTGTKINGPAIVTELTTTTVIPPNWKVFVDNHDNMLMTKAEE